MTTLVYDIEADNLLPGLTKLHCIVTRDIDDPIESYDRYHTPDGLRMGIWSLEKADRIIAHNQIGYDLEAISKLYPNFKRPPWERVVDTLVLSRLAYPDRHGGHSLKAWAEYLSKRGDIDVPEKYFISDWSNQSIEDYLTRCETDVMINIKVYEFLIRQMKGTFGGEELWNQIV